MEKERIYKFLLGLNKDLDEVHGVIIARGQTTRRKHVGSFMENLQKPSSSKKVGATQPLTINKLR